MKSPLKAWARGITVVASDATSGVWVIPINNNEIKAVEGKPPMRPPILLPYLSAIIVLKVIQALPTKKLSVSLYQKKYSIIFEKLYRLNECLCYLSPIIFKFLEFDSIISEPNRCQ
jgi:hypothetical protein